MNFSKVVLLFTISCVVSSTTFMKIKLLEDNLFTDYNPLLRPVNNSSQPLNVSADISFSKLAELEEVDEMMVTWFDLQLTWTDERLMWKNSSRYPDVKMMRLPVQKLWTPRLHVHESFDREKEEHDDVIEVFSTGQTYWYLRVYSKSPCPLDISKFPFDKQSCSVAFVVKNANEDEVRIGEVYMNIAGQVKNGEWAINELTAETIVINDFQRKRSGFRLNYNFERKNSYYMYYLIWPMFILIMVNPFVLLIDNASGERVSVCVALFLSITVFLSQLSSMLPNSSSGIPYLTIYLYMNYGMSAYVVIFAIIAPLIPEGLLRQFLSLFRLKNDHDVYLLRNDVNLYCFYLYNSFILLFTVICVTAMFY